MIQDINLQVYEMRKNGYTFVEIANALRCSDECPECGRRLND